MPYRDRLIIPVMYRTCQLPMNYLNLNYIDFRGEKYQKNFAELLEELNIKSATGILPASARKKKILRGDSWKDSAVEVCAVNRYAANPMNFNSFVGFRCASDVKP